jgi:site-specific DNA-cytosine methylase
VTLTHGELFAGYGGFGLGFERADIRTVWRVEIDRDAQKVLRHHHPDDLLLSDVRECGAHNLPPVDVISFGSPCQDFSVAGKRAGIGGERSGLIHEALRIVRELSPTLAVWENVPGVLSSDSGRGFLTILRAFRECGARDIAWRILDAQHFGVPQRRRRVFLVADFGGERAGPVLFESPCGCGHPAPGREKGPRVAPSVTPGARRASGQRGREQLTCGPAVAFNAQFSNQGVTEGVCNTLGTETQEAVAYQCHGSNVGPMGTVRSGNGGLTGGVPFVAEPIPLSPDAAGGRTGDAVTPSPDAEGKVRLRPPSLGVGEEGEPAGTVAAGGVPGVAYVVNAAESNAVKDHARESETARSLDTTGGFAANQGGTVVAQAVQEDNQNGVCVRDTAGSLRADAPGHQPCGSLVATTVTWRGRGLEEGGPIANAIRSGGEGHTGDQSGYVRAGMVVRRLLPVECARLMSVPDDYLDLDPPLSDSAKYRLLGNGVVVNVAEWVGRRIVEVLACPPS